MRVWQEAACSGQEIQGDDVRFSSRAAFTAPWRRPAVALKNQEFSNLSVLTAQDFVALRPPGLEPGEDSALVNVCTVSVCTRSPLCARDPGCWI